MPRTSMGGCRPRPPGHHDTRSASPVRVARARRSRGLARVAQVPASCYIHRLSKNPARRGQRFMTSVRVRENEPFEVALRRFKRTDREDRPAHRTARPRVLRKADRRAQAQARRRGQAPLQAPAQPAAAAEAVLTPSAALRNRGAKRFAPFCSEVRPMSLKPHHRRHEGRHAREGRGAAVDDAAAARRDQAARGRRAHRAHRRRRAVDHREDDQAAARSIAQFEAGKRQDLAANEQSRWSCCRLHAGGAVRGRDRRAIAEAIAATGAPASPTWAR